MVTSIRSVTSDPLCQEPSGPIRVVDEALGNPVLCKETLVSREPASGDAVLVEVLEPFLRDIKVIIHQTVAGVPGVGKEYPDLAVLPFGPGCRSIAALPRCNGPFLHEAGIINREHRAWYGSSGLTGAAGKYQ